jgi:hypothetical protein
LTQISAKLASLVRRLPACLPAALLLQTAGSEQALLVQQLLQEQQAGGAPAFRDVRVHEDCYGVPRFVSATIN